MPEKMLYKKNTKINYSGKPNYINFCKSKIAVYPFLHFVYVIHMFVFFWSFLSQAFLQTVDELWSEKSIPWPSCW